MARSNRGSACSELLVLDAVEQVEPAQHAFVGVEALGMLAHHAPQLALLHLRRDRRHHPRRELVLQRKKILGLAGEAVGPDRPAAFAVAQLGRQPHLGAGAAHAARQHVAHGELAAHVAAARAPSRDSAAPRRGEITISSGRHESAAMMSSTSPSLSHELAASPARSLGAAVAAGRRTAARRSRAAGAGSCRSPAPSPAAAPAPPHRPAPAG